MASPRLKSGFLLIDAPISLAKKASTIRGAFGFSKPIENPQQIDLAVIGSVAVDKNGNRLGKGGGYGDQEIKLARSFNAQIVSNVHSLQVVSKVPVDIWDEKIDIIITEKEIIRIEH